MTGALKSTPINDMETITGLEPMGDRREVKLEKMKRLQHHPMRERVTTGTKSLLKRLSFLHKARKSLQDLEIPAQDRPEPMNTTSATPWSMQKKPEIRDSIEDVGTKTQVPHGTTDTPNPEIHRASFPKWRMDQGLHERFSH